MEKDSLTFSLNFESYSIDFDVWVDWSVELTNGFKVSDQDFVFAAGEVWMRVASFRHLVIPARSPANMLMTLKDLASAFRTAPSAPGIEEVLRRGGWGAWMQGYWDRVARDCSRPDDEATYALLSPLEMLDSRQGHVAIYRYGGAPTIEIATRPELGDPVFAWSGFDPERAAHEADCLREEMHVAIKRAINPASP